MTIFGGYLILALIVLILKLARISGSQLLLGTVHTFYSVDPSQSAATRLKPEELKTKKGRKEYIKQQLQIAGAAQQIHKQTLTPDHIKALPFSDDVNSMAAMGLTILLNCLLVLAGAALMGGNSGVVSVTVSLLILVYVTYAALKVEYAIQKRSFSEAVVTITVFAVGAALAAVALMWAPGVELWAGSEGPEVPLLPFDVKPAARGLDALLHSVHLRVAERARMPVPEMGRMDPVWLTIPVAVIAGMLAVSLMGPGLLYSKLFYRAVNVPTYAEPYLKKTKTVNKVLQLAFLLPVAAMLSQFLPLSCHWGMDRSQAELVLIVLLVGVAVTHYMIITPLSQTYLDIGLTEWYLLLHNGYDFEGKMTVVRARLDLLRQLLCKTVVHLSSPPLLALSMGLLLLLSSGTTDKLANATAPHRERWATKLPPHLAPYIYTPPYAANTTTPTLADTIASISHSKNNVTGIPTHDPVADSQGSTNSDTIELLGLGDDGSDVSINVSGGASQAGSKAGSERQGKQTEEVFSVGKPEDLWRFLSYFLGWWSCTVWSVYAGSSLLVHRLGLNSG